ncbi:hypothetical protein ACFFJY_17285 [Fictibacillus aquaticus]|uniref:hypothetical protein n=1 Tax=Fictibacillus aquaticus TaxID=2021314 RepID=UPI001055AEDF|nr:hypothetical protein [Fictibacillus aquaticus]
MKNALQLLLLSINVLYIVVFFIQFGFVRGSFWLVFFILGTALSAFYLFLRRESSHNPYLSIALLASSLSCIGAYSFQYYLVNLMG